MAAPKLSRERRELYKKLMLAVLMDEVNYLTEYLLKEMERLDQAAARPKRDSTVSVLLHHAHPFPNFRLNQYDRKRALAVLKAMKVLDRSDSSMDMYLESGDYSTDELAGAAKISASAFQGSPMHVAVALRHTRCFSELLKAGGTRALDVCENIQNLPPLRFIEGMGTKEENTDEAEMFLEAMDYREKEE